ncbi:MAG: MMPL family transporter, partial [Candidatus Limnocylindrales bacterium]
MFTRWGALVYHRRRLVLLVALVVGLASASVMGRAPDVLSAGGWLDPGSESAAVANRLADEFGQGRGSLVLVYLGPDGGDARGEAFQAEIATSVADLRDDP